MAKDRQLELVVAELERLVNNQLEWFEVELEQLVCRLERLKVALEQLVYRLV